MIEAKCERGFSAPRFLVIVCLLTTSVLLSACASIAKYSDKTIPKPLLPVEDADFDKLTAQLKHFTDIESIRATRISLQFIDAGSSERYRRADATLVLKRPENIRLIVQIPIAKTKLAEMVSDAQRFKVAIYYDRYKRFLMGSNRADYSQWRQQLDSKESQSAFINARPFHFTDALLVQPLHIGEDGFVYSLQEELLEEPDVRPGAKKGARLLRSFYVISEMIITDRARGLSKLKRRFWFDRNDHLQLKRQQVFDVNSKLVTDILYSNYQKLSDDSQILRPSVVEIRRPYDAYSAELNFLTDSVELNVEDLPATAFELLNTENLPETDLDKPIAKP